MSEPSRSRLRGVLTLLRPPNVFTAVADPMAGLVLVGQGLTGVGLWLVPASACLYLGGMALNDYFDREVDAEERPERPIPSGAVSAGAAAGIGGGLLTAGLFFASLAGTMPLLVAAALAMAIIAYDAVSKGTEIGFLNMGLCRGLNFGMPLALAAEPVSLLACAAPVLLAAYVAALTYLARDEVGGNTRARARRGVEWLASVLAAVAAALAFGSGTFFGWLFFAAVVARAFELFAPLVRQPDGPTTGRAIGGGILLIPVFDAVFVAAAGQEVAAIVVASLTLPAIALRRFFPPT